MQDLEEISEPPEGNDVGVPTSENYRTTYWRRPNEKSAAGEDRYYPLHPNLPRYSGAKSKGGSYVIPYLKGRCESWMPAFQVADVDWYTSLTKSLDPASIIKGPKGLESKQIRSERLKYMSLDLTPDESIDVPFQTTEERLPSGMTFGGHSIPNPSFLFEMIDFTTNFELDVIVVDVDCESEYLWKHANINVEALKTLTQVKAVVVVDRKLDRAYGTPAHPVFADGILEGVVVVKNLDAECLRGTNVVVYSSFNDAEDLYKTKLSLCDHAWLVSSRGKGEYVSPMLYEKGNFAYVNLLEPTKNVKSPEKDDRVRVLVVTAGKESFALPYGIGRATEIVAQVLDDLFGTSSAYGEVLEVMKMTGGYLYDVFGVWPSKKIPGRPDLEIAAEIDRMIYEFDLRSKGVPHSEPEPQVSRPKGAGRIFKRPV